MVRFAWMPAIFDDLAKYADDQGLLSLKEQVLQAKQIAETEVALADQFPPIEVSVLTVLNSTPAHNGPSTKGEIAFSSSSSNSPVAVVETRS